MTSAIPYTYLLKWTSTGMMYYGVRYAANCNPMDLWNPYKTSSKYVKQYIQIHGDPDIISVRKTFSCNDAIKKAQSWEHTFLRRTKAMHNPNFLNRTDNKSISPEDCGKAAKIAAKKRKTRNKTNWPALAEISMRYTGRTKDSHPHIAAQADKLRGRTKKTHQYLERKAIATANQMSKTWQITSPDGEVVKVFNITEWCRDNKFARGSAKNGFTCKGYSFKTITDIGVNTCNQLP